MRCRDPLVVPLLCAVLAGAGSLFAGSARAEPHDVPANAPALSTGQVDGPIELGPSWAETDPQHSAATLHTMLDNYGTVADRLIQVRCPYAGHVALINGTGHSDVMAPNPAQESRGAREAQNAGLEQNGLDLPPALSGRPKPVQADFRLADAKQPLGPGALIPCTVNLAHGGQRIVVFTVGPKPEAVAEP